MNKPAKEKTFTGLKIIWKYLNPHKRMIFVLLVLSVLIAIADATAPYLVGKIIDSIFLDKSFINIFSYSLPLAGFFIAIWFCTKIISDIFSWQLNLRRENLAVTVMGEYITGGFGHLIDLPLSFHKKNKIGEITDKINRASNVLDSLVSSVIINLLPQFLSIVMAFIIIFSIKVGLSLLIFSALLVYVFILFKITPAVVFLRKKEQKAWNKAHGEAFDVVLNAQAVKQATAEAYEKNKFHKNFLLKAVGFWQSLWKIWQKMNFIQRLIVSFTQLMVFLISIFFIWKKEMTVGQLIMFNGYTAMVFGPFTALAQNWSLVQNGLISLGRAEKILSQPKEIYVPKNAIILKKINGEVMFDKVSFCYEKGRQKVLNQVSFLAKSGEVIALVGESGMGKSTLVDLISCYFQPSSGKILIDGFDIKRLNLKFLRSQIAVVSQEVVLFNDTIKNNIRYGSFSASEKMVKEAAQKAHCVDFIEKFPKKYEQIVGERGVKLSVGQKQRIAIARAILRNPKILILDEPTSALDAKSEKFVTESLESLMKGRTTFIVAHRLSTVQKANRILVLEKGEIIEEGNHSELIKIENGAYRKFYELQKL